MGNYCCPSATSIENRAAAHSIGEFAPAPSSSVRPRSAIRQGEFIPHDRLISLPRYQPSLPRQEGQGMPEYHINKQQMLFRCCGVLLRVQFSSKSDKALVGNGFLISTSLLMTAKSNLVSRRNPIDVGLLVFSSFYDHEEYEVERQIDFCSGLSQERLIQGSGYCFLRLKRPVHTMTSCPLAFEYAHQLGEAFSAMNQQNHLKIKPITISLQSLYEFVSYNSLGDSKMNGCAIAIFHEGQWFIIGLQINTNRRRKSSSAILFNEEMIDALCEVTTIHEKQRIKIYGMDKSEIWSLAQYSYKRFGKLMIANESIDRKKVLENVKKFNKMKRSSQLSGTGLSILVNCVPLYFFFDELDDKVEHLNNQYRYVTSKQLVLSYKGLNIPLDFPLMALTIADREFKLFQRFLNIINGPGYQNRQVSQDYLLAVDQAIKKQRIQSHNNQNLYVNIKKDKEIVSRFWFETDLNITFNQLIAKLKEKYAFSFQKFQLFDRSGVKLQNFNSQLMTLSCNEIQIDLLDLQCSISFQSIVRAQKLSEKSSKDSNGYKNIELSSILSSEDEFSLLSFDKKDQTFTFSSVKRKGVGYPEKWVYLLTYGCKDQQFQLQCAEDTLVKTLDFQWKFVRNITSGEKILGVKRDDETTLIEYIVIQIDMIQAAGHSYCWVQIEGTHNFVANNLIVHNNDFIKVGAQFYSEGKFTYQKAYFNVPKSQRINVKFPNQRVFAGRVELNTRLSYGDYATSVTTLTVFNQGQKQPIGGVMTFIYRKLQLPTASFLHELLADIEQIRSNYYGLQTQRIIGLTPEYLKHLLKLRHPNIQIEPKSILARKIYYSKSIDHQKYIHRFQKVYQRYMNLSSQFMNIYNQVQFEGITMVQHYFIYRYLTGLSHDLSFFLNEIDPLNMSQYQLQYIQTKLLCNTLQKLPKFTQSRRVYNYMTKNQMKHLPIIDNNIFLFKKFTRASREKLPPRYQVSFLQPKQEKPFQQQNDELIWLYFQTVTARDISKVSQDTWNYEILIMPFTYFFIEDRQQNLNGVWNYRLKQINLPRTNKPKVLLWVVQDDQNDYNEDKQEYLAFSRQDIQLVVVFRSTLKIILEKFLWIQSLFKKKIVIVNEIRGQGEGVENSLNIYKEYGISAKIVLYDAKKDKIAKRLSENPDFSCLRIFSAQQNFVKIVKDIFDQEED